MRVLCSPALEHCPVPYSEPWEAHTIALTMTHSPAFLLAHTTEQRFISGPTHQHMCALVMRPYTRALCVGPMHACRYLIRGKGYLDLSEEQLVDCVDQWHLYQGWACSGGYASEALRYAKNNRVTTEAKYPYQVWPCRCRMPACR